MSLDPTLLAALETPSFTPGRRHFAPLLDLVAADAEKSGAAQRALARAGAAAGRACLERLRAAEPPARGRLAGALARIARGTAELHPALCELLRDPDDKTRAAAARGLGKLTGADAAAVTGALLAAWKVETAPGPRRSLAEALGKIGGPAALAALEQESAAPAAAAAPAVQAAVGRARAIARRTIDRAAPASIEAAAAPPTATPVHLRCRAGLEGICAAELPAPARARAVAPGLVAATLAGPVGALAASRTWLSVGFPLPRGGGPLPDRAAAVAAALTSPQARALVEALGRGPARYRIAFAAGGHRRALVHRIAAAVDAAGGPLVNDPTDSIWEAVVYEAGPRPEEVDVELVARGLPDERFAYRRADVPAASHPTIAAALARIAEARAGDVVLDPFVGSGLELAERALLGPYRALHGVDQSRRALDAAAKNLASVGAHDVHLTVGDAVGFEVSGVTLIITNPPMGRRVETGPLAALLERFVAHACGQLGRGGRLVWISPMPERTAAAGAAAGCRVALRQRVDMGGFSAEIQRFDKK